MPRDPLAALKKLLTPRLIAVAAAGTVALVIVGVWLLFPSGDAKSLPAKSGGPPPVSVEAVPARVGNVVVDAEVVGTLLANESVMIRPEVTGRIDQILFTEGQTVKKGTTLVTLDAGDLRAQLAQSESAARLAKLNYERLKSLREKQLVSQQAYDEAAARLIEAEAKEKLDRVRLAKAVLRAPFTGMLGVRRVSPGDYVAPGQDIVNLESIDPLKVEMRLPETYARDLSPGKAIRVRVDAFPGETYDGEIYVIDPRVDVTTRTLLLRARIPNKENKLRPGMFASAVIELARRENAVLVPEQALVPSGQDQFVFRIVDGKATRTKVQVGVRRKGDVEILAGVQPQEMIVTAGHQKLRDGQAVAVEAAAAPASAVPGTSAGKP